MSFGNAPFTGSFVLFGNSVPSRTSFCFSVKGGCYLLHLLFLPHPRSCLMISIFWCKVGNFCFPIATIWFSCIPIHFWTHLLILWTEAICLLLIVFLSVIALYRQRVNSKSTAFSLWKSASIFKMDYSIFCCHRFVSVIGFLRFLFECLFGPFCALGFGVATY